MDMNKRLISVFTLNAALGIAGAGMAFALTGDLGDDDPKVADTAGEVSDGLPLYDAEPPDATSIDDIDPDVCNVIHNINACTLDELDELGMAPVTGSIAVGEYYPVPSVGPEPEPLFPGDEAPCGVQSYEEAVVQDCGLAGGTVYVTADGEIGGDIVHELPDGEAGETPAAPPAIVPEPEVQASAG